MNIILLLGGLIGLSSILMAAYVDHALSVYLSGKALTSVLTAVRYHQLYAIVICAIGLSLPMQTNILRNNWLKRAAYLFIFGIVLFSFSIYFSAIFNIAKITYLTPLGGVTLMIAWVFLICASLLRNK